MPCSERVSWLGPTRFSASTTRSCSPRRLPSWSGWPGGLELEASDDWAIEVASRHAFERIPEDERGAGKFHRAATPGLWQENMGPAEQAVMQEVMGDKLRELGYDAD